MEIARLMNTNAKINFSFLRGLHSVFLADECEDVRCVAFVFLLLLLLLYNICSTFQWRYVISWSFFQPLKPVAERTGFSFPNYWISSRSYYFDRCVCARARLCVPLWSSQQPVCVCVVFVWLGWLSRLCLYDRMKNSHTRFNVVVVVFARIQWMCVLRVLPIFHKHTSRQFTYNWTKNLIWCVSNPHTISVACAHSAKHFCLSLLQSKRMCVCVCLCLFVCARDLL